MRQQQNGGGDSGIISGALALRRAFGNWPILAVLVPLVLPSRVPPKRGISFLASARVKFRTRLGPVLEAEIGNSWPIIEVFEGEYDSHLQWSDVHRVVDVGAHVGAFTCWVAANAPSSSVIAFEPEPRNFADLVRNVSANHYLHRVELINAAVGAEAARRTLHVPLIDRQRASFLSVHGHSRKITVQSVSLDDYLRREEVPVDLLKFDCEGAEWEILPSLSAETWKGIREIVMEVHTDGRDRTARAMSELLGRMGFSTSLISNRKSYVGAITVWARRTQR